MNYRYKEIVVENGEVVALPDGVIVVGKVNKVELSRPGATVIGMLFPEIEGV